MKTLLCSLLLTVSAVAVATADIQSPPAVEYGPTRKLGRGLSNMTLAITDWQNTIATVNDQEGNAAIPYGFVKGAGRFLARTGVGFFEVITFPFPTNKGKYTPTLRNDVPWIYSGFEEFPPELGFETRYHYVRQ
jgi:putative exosortase-associated protein (TIGR04073 family)